MLPPMEKGYSMGWIEEKPIFRYDTPKLNDQLIRIVVSLMLHLLSIHYL